MSTTSDGNPYLGGRRSFSTDGGSSWTLGTTANNDNGFRVYVDTGFSPKVIFVSNVKDANPGVNFLPVWGDLIWTNATLPTGTDIRFQAAASNSLFGPFDFVGPDGTSNTFFANGESLSQFDGSRYLRYKAVLSSMNGTNSPALNEVNVCFTNQAAPNCADVSIPPLTSQTGIPLSLPVNVTEISGLAARSVDFTIDFDPQILTPAGNDANKWGVTLGTVGTSNGGGRTLTVTRPSPGTLVISVFGINDMSGAGALVNLNFNVIGEPNAATGLSLTSFVFNEGTPCSNTSNGSVTIVSGSLSGRAVFGNTGSAPFDRAVPDVTITAAGSVQRSGTTDSDGTYSINAFGPGDYTATPSKIGDDGTSISGFDAAAIAAHVVGGTPLTNNQVIVADVSGNGTITSFDAAMIASFTVGLPESGSTGSWRFVPLSRSYTNMHSDRNDQDYVALLMGDVTGNWTAQPQPVTGSELAEGSEPLAISASRVTAGVGTTVTVPVKISNTSGLGIQAYEFDVQYDPEVLQPAETSVSIAGTISDGRVLMVNAGERGILKVVVFGAYLLEGEGNLINFHFNAIGTAGSSTELKWERFRLNESGINFKTESGEGSVLSKFRQ